MARPEVVCLCGSTRFSAQFRRANYAFTMGGRIVLTIGCDTKSDTELKVSRAAKARLDDLHLRKIDLADRVYVLNVGGYIGESTRREIAYALSMGRKLEFLEPDVGEAYLTKNAHELGALAAAFAMEAREPLCAHCCARRATCLGQFGAMMRAEHACDACCAHDGTRGANLGTCTKVPT